MLRSIQATTGDVDALATWLAENGVLGEEALARGRAVSEQSREPLHIVLSRLGLVEDTALRDGFCAVMHLHPALASDLRTVAPIADSLGYRFLSTARALPVAASEDTIDLAMADPTDRASIDAIALKTGCAITIRPAAASEIEAALDRCVRAAAEESADALPDLGHGTDADIARLRDQASETPVIQLVNQMIRRAVDARASDIHLEPGPAGLTIRQRVDGALMAMVPPPSDLATAVISRIKIMAGLNIAEQRLPQDGRIRITAAGREIDLRVATLPTFRGEAVVLRLLDRSGLVLDFAGLGFSETSIAAIEPLLNRPNGMFLVTGPTGSGKTTTLYAALSRLNRPETKIITVEDPVEYQLDGVTQVQVRPQIGLGFAEVIRAILRNNPNIVMIGEIRDPETASIAVQAALTGHLVLATLHTNSAVAAINRLRDMGVEDYLIGATVIGVMAQRLVRRLCPDCSVPEDPGPGFDGAFRAPNGCDTCHGTGFRGRMGVHEILTVTPEIRSAVLSRASETEIERLATESGMVSLRDDGIAKAASGAASLAEVLHLATATG